MSKRNRTYRRPRPSHSYSEFSSEAFIAEANRPGHVCGPFAQPCIHHGSLHCLACCIRDGQADQS